jgi:hypothetical protein
LQKKYFSSHKLPKQQSTSFWSQGILGVKDPGISSENWFVSKVGDLIVVGWT